MIAMHPYKGKLTPEQRAEVSALQLEGGHSIRGIAKMLDLPYGQVRGYAEWQAEVKIEPPHSPKILVFDIENAPHLAWVWSFWNTNVVDVEQYSYLLSFSYAWYDLRTNDIGEVGFVSVMQDPEWGPDSDRDIHVVMKLWELLDEADIVIGQNSKSFDIKKFNARGVVHGLRPPSPFTQVDTKTAASAIGNFGSNSLKHLAKQLGITLKEENRGFGLWRDCMRGDEKAWAEMESYNKQDVRATAALYSRLLPWMPSSQHPNLGLYIADEGKVCRNCGNKERESGGEGFQYRGKHVTNASKFRTVCCNKCGSYSREFQRVPQRSLATRTDLR